MKIVFVILDNMVLIIIIIWFVEIFLSYYGFWLINYFLNVMSITIIQ